MPRTPHEHYLKLKERHPGVLEAVEALGEATRGCGPLDTKTVHLVQLAAAATLRSHGATHSHAIRALEAGATAEEIRHAVIALTGTIGFPTVAAALSWVDDVLEKRY
jgi:4-carboxymuconolactone decarboxylase